jgi:hypothetical protein
MDQEIVIKSGFSEIFRSFFVMGVVMMWGSVEAGPVADGYCEDMVRYGGVDLKPCVVPPAN